MPVLKTAALSLGFGERRIVNAMDLDITRGEVICILGPNGSGKSTLLKGIARNLKPTAGAVYLDGRDIHTLSAKAVARKLAVLPQKHEAAGDVSVRELVEYGRFPHQNWWQGTRSEDDAIIEQAMCQTGVASLADRAVSTLSGGESQRAWIAMALAQKPQVLLLDEPTTYLDICHQLEVMELVRRLNQNQGLTVIMVLHDINHAARYASRILVINQGSLYAAGSPEQVITREMLAAVFGVEAELLTGSDGSPVIVARGLARQSN
ncbi:MAG: ABC transporter ATP-binding protein [Sporomusaceae bacterium]|nr:ABC transporter ATP-binding protein [Sporomusaceae bacterium]